MNNNVFFVPNIAQGAGLFYNPDVHQGHAGTNCHFHDIKAPERRKSHKSLLLFSSKIQLNTLCHQLTLKS
jgi:hypothetical protein